MSGSWGGRPDAPVEAEPRILDSWGDKRAERALQDALAGKREKWDQRGLGLALEVATWSSCSRAQVGAIVMNADHDVVATGFNDTAAGLLNCGDGGCPRAAREDIVPGQAYLDEDECLHAEQNALQRAGLAARGSVLYVTRIPCGNCTRQAKTAGIERIVVVQPDE